MALLETYDHAIDDNGQPRGYRSEPRGAPIRTPLHATITATGTRAQLTTATGGDAHSHASWYLILQPGAVSVRLGTDTVTASTQLRILADATNQVRWHIPSATLDGWYVISEGADVSVELAGAVDT